MQPVLEKRNIAKTSAIFSESLMKRATAIVYTFKMDERSDRAPKVESFVNWQKVHIAKNHKKLSIPITSLPFVLDLVTAFGWHQIREMDTSLIQKNWYSKASCKVFYTSPFNAGNKISSRRTEAMELLMKLRLIKMETSELYDLSPLFREVLALNKAAK